MGDLIHDQYFLTFAAAVISSAMTWFAGRMKHKESMQAYVETGFRMLYEQLRLENQELRSENEVLRKRLAGKSDLGNG